jgi:hypothetical protein
MRNPTPIIETVIEITRHFCNKRLWVFYSENEDARADIYRLAQMFEKQWKHTHPTPETLTAFGWYDELDAMMDRFLGWIARVASETYPLGEKDWNIPHFVVAPSGIDADPRKPQIG